MKRILALTDFSSNAGIALAIAMDIALKSSAEIFLVHFEYAGDAIAHVPGVHLTDNTTEDELRASRLEMDLLVAECARTGITMHAMLVQDTGLEKVTDYAEGTGCDLVVMGAHGKSGWRPLAGSTVQRVIRDTRVPVLVVPDRPRPMLPLRDFIFASTFRHDQHQALAKTVELARLFRARIHMVFLNLFSHLIREEVAREKVTQNIAGYRDISFTVQVVNTNDERWGLEVLAARLDAGVIAVAIEHRSMLGRLLDPPFALRLLSELSVPLLLVPPSAD